MAKVIGVGGIFLQFKGNEQELKTWYQKHLKVDMSEYGTGFINGEQLTLLTFKSPSSQTPLINLRVDDLSVMIKHLKSVNTEITSDIKTYPYGDFAQFKDPFGNIIELWEPNIQEYKKMVLKEINDYKEKHKL